MRILTLCVAAMIALAPAGASAKDTAPASFAFVTDGGAPVALTETALKALPQVEEKVTFQSSKGVSSAVYKGPLLWDVVQSTKALDGLEHNAELAKILMVSAADGYRVAYSIGEMAPDFGNAKIILALEVDGKPLPRGFRVVVQGDKRGARAVYEITKIELK